MEWVLHIGKASQCQIHYKKTQCPSKNAYLHFKNPQSIKGIIPATSTLAYAAADLVTEEQGTPEITTVYTDTTVVLFDLFSFYFGCVIGLEQSEASVLVSCTVAATCVNPAGQTVATQSFSFVSNGGLVQNMVEAKPSGFLGCQFVSFNTTSAGGATTATVMDTVSYTVYSELPFSPK